MKKIYNLGVRLGRLLVISHTVAHFLFVVVFNIPPTDIYSHMEMGPMLKDSSDRLLKLQIEAATLGLQGDQAVYPLHHSGSCTFFICLGTF